jgi:uncharacterized delta-60 repeat protein
LHRHYILAHTRKLRLFVALLFAGCGGSPGVDDDASVPDRRPPDLRDSDLGVVDAATGTTANVITDGAVSPDAGATDTGVADTGVADFSRPSDLALVAPPLADGGVINVPEMRPFVATALAVQADGKIVFAGEGGYNPLSFALLRANADGTIDTKFGDQGLDIIPVQFGSCLVCETNASAVAIQPDGKIVAVGYDAVGQFAGSDPPTHNLQVVRTLPDGGLDPAFVAPASIAGPARSVASSLALGPDGTIFVSGQLGSVGLIGRFLPDGSIDSGFGDQGFVRTDTWDPEAAAGSMVVQPDGRIVVELIFDTSNTRQALLARLDGKSGALDPTFGTGGMTPVFSPAYTMDPLVQRPDGRLLFAGDRLYQLDADGALDPAFGTAKAAVLLAIPGRSVVVQPRGLFMFGKGPSLGPELIPFDGSGNPGAPTVLLADPAAWTIGAAAAPDGSLVAAFQDKVHPGVFLARFAP